jgi:hypothetical protein
MGRFKEAVKSFIFLILAFLVFELFVTILLVKFGLDVSSLSSCSI